MDQITPGPTQEVPGSRVQRLRETFQREVDYAEKSHTHLWVIITTYVTTADALTKIHAGDEQAHLDAESLRDIAYGCYLCETPWEQRQAHRKCPGHPKGGRR